MPSHANSVALAPGVSVNPNHRVASASLDVLLRQGAVIGRRHLDQAERFGPGGGAVLGHPAEGRHPPVGMPAARAAQEGGLVAAGQAGTTGPTGFVGPPIGGSPSPGIGGIGGIGLPSPSPSPSATRISP